MCDHFVLHQYLCGTTLYCTVYLISTYVGPLCIASVHIWDHFVLHCLPHQYLCGTTLHIAKVGIYLISRPTCMCDHFVLHCDCLPHQYLCDEDYFVLHQYLLWDHFVLYCLPHQYLCGPLCIASSVGLSACVTTLYCTVTVYLTSTYVGPLCIVSVPMWDHFVLHCLPHQYLCGTTLYCISTYV